MSLTTHVPKLDKGITKKKKERKRKEKNYRLILPMNISAKVFNKILTNQIQQYIKRIIYHDEVGFIPRKQG